MTLTVGAEVAGYRLLEGPYTNGTYGLVYKAECLANSDIVALKLARDPTDKDQLDRFKQESELLHYLHQHGNIVEPKSAFLIDGVRHIYTMEFLEESLEQVLLGITAADPRAKLEIFLNICRGLQHAHSKNVYHRDLHSENIRFEASVLIPKLTDFGKSKAMHLPPLSSQPFHEWGGFVQPPEVWFRTAENPTNEEYMIADLYSLGLMLHSIFNSPARLHHINVTASIHNYIIPLNPSNPDDFYNLPLADRKQHYVAWLNIHNPNIANLLDVHLVDVSLANDISEIIKRICHPDTSLRYQSVDEIMVDVDGLL